MLIRFENKSVYIPDYQLYLKDFAKEKNTIKISYIS